MSCAQFLIDGVVENQSVSDEVFAKFVLQPLNLNNSKTLSPAWNYFKTAYVKNSEERIVPIPRLANRALCAVCLKSLKRIKRFVLFSKK